MSLLHLLGVDDGFSFCGKDIDKTVDNIKGYANNKFSEEDIDSANGTLEDILSYAESIDSLENISNNVTDLEFRTNQLIGTNLVVFKILKRISNMASEYCEANNKQHIQDLLHTVAEEAEEGINELNTVLDYQLDFHNTFSADYFKFKQYITSFVPREAILSHSYKSGQVCYVSGDWEFELSTYVGYGGLRMTPKAIRFKQLDYCKACDKIAEIGLDPQKLTIEDVQLLKIVDNHNSLIYDLFVKII